MLKIKRSLFFKPANLIFAYLFSLSFTFLFIERAGQATPIDEIILLLITPISILGIAKYFSIKYRPILFLLTYFLFTIASSILALIRGHEIPVIAPVIGIILDIKFIIFWGALTYLSSRQKSDPNQIIIDICKAIHLIGLLQIPFIFRDIFSPGFSLSGIPLIPSPIYGFTPIGLFSHKVSIATLSALALIASFILFFSTQNKRYVFSTLLFIIVLFLSNSFKEILILIPLSAFIIRSSQTSNNKIRRSAFIALFTFIAATPLLTIYFGQQIAELTQNRISTYGLSETVRGLLYEISAKIANDYFPLGSGAGTFSSQPSRDIYYSPLYYEYGLSTYYGATPENPAFLLDVGWAKFIGEAGWIGGSAYAISYLYSFFKLFKSCLLSPNIINIFGSLIGALIFASALGQSIFNAEIGIILCALLFFTHQINSKNNLPGKNQTSSKIIKT